MTSYDTDEVIPNCACLDKQMSREAIVLYETKVKAVMCRPVQEGS